MQARFARFGLLVALVGGLAVLAPLARAQAGSSPSDIPLEVNTVDESQPQYYDDVN